MFEDAPEESKKNIFFLSDGAPDDEETAFMSEVANLRERGRYLPPWLLRENSNEELMSSIATSVDNIFTVSTAEDIELKFTTVYEVINEADDVDFIVKQFKKNTRWNQKQ